MEIESHKQRELTYILFSIVLKVFSAHEGQTKILEHVFKYLLNGI